MSDDAGPSTANISPRSSSAQLTPSSPSDHGPSGSYDDWAEIRAKRLGSLRDLVRSLDLLIYAELAIVYYMDVSLLRFFIRAFMQLLYLTPKPPMLPVPPNARNRPYVGAILGTNILCIILHIFLAVPAAGEATRGYLHGGLMIDFIGQEGPSSKIHMALLDFVVAGLQMIMLAAATEERRLDRKKKTRSGRRTALGDAAAANSNSRTQSQVLSNVERLSGSNYDSADSQAAVRVAENGFGGAELLARLRSGQALTAKLYPVDVMRKEFVRYRKARWSSSSQEQAIANTTLV